MVVSTIGDAWAWGDKSRTRWSEGRVPTIIANRERRSALILCPRLAALVARMRRLAHRLLCSTRRTETIRPVTDWMTILAVWLHVLDVPLARV